jgi:hypothetical protein
MTSISTPGASGAQPQQAESRQSRPAADRSLEALARSRVAIEGVWPQIDGGRFPVKRAVGDRLVVEADIFCDGHDKIDAALLYRRDDEGSWRETPLRLVDNDRWRGAFDLADNARYHYTIIAWRDVFASWRDEMAKKRAAGVPISLELTEGRLLIEHAASDSVRGSESDRRALQRLAIRLQELSDEDPLIQLLLGDDAGRGDGPNLFGLGLRVAGKTGRRGRQEDLERVPPLDVRVAPAASERSCVAMISGSVSRRRRATGGPQRASGWCRSHRRSER